MADDKVSSSVANEESFSVSMGGGSTEYAHDDGKGVESNPYETKETATDVSNTPDATSDEPEVGDEASEQDESTENEDTEVEDSEGDEQSTPEDLGEFDPEDTSKWDAQYKTEDGSLNEAALSAEFWANASDDIPGSLNEGTYAYLESLGISKGMAKNVEAALVTQHQAAENEKSSNDGQLFEVAGGPEPLRDALDWGKEGGYSKEQQARFNKIMEGNDLDAKKEAVELLMVRHGKAKASEKPALPKRDATKGQGKPTGGLKPFTDRAAYRAARDAAGDNQEARRVVAQRLAISDFG